MMDSAMGCVKQGQGQLILFRSLTGKLPAALPYDEEEP